MKPIYFLFAVALGSPLQPALGQASFYFRNYSTSLGIDAPVYDWSGNLLTGSNWRFELYGGLTQDSLTPVVTFGDLNRAIVPVWVPGYFKSDKEVIVPGVPGAGWAWLQVKAWDVGLGGTYEEAVAKGLGGYGQSPLFYAMGGDPTAPTPTLPFPLAGLQSFSVLEVVPEPAVGLMLLAGLPALWWRGRKQR